MFLTYINTYFSVNKFSCLLSINHIGSSILSSDLQNIFLEFYRWVQGILFFHVSLEKEGVLQHENFAITVFGGCIFPCLQERILLLAASFVERWRYCKEICCCQEGQLLRYPIHAIHSLFLDFPSNSLQTYLPAEEG